MSAESLPSRYEPSEIEPALYRRWMEGGYFHLDEKEVTEKGRDPYVIVIPPPNVTAVLHIGHGLNGTVQDVLIRWRRMKGDAALWVPGTDHAGIATQNVVERRLAQRGLRKEDLGREAFLEEVWGFVRETGGTILDQLKAIGASCDWDRTRFTLDPELSRAVRETFVRLHEKGLIYRGEYIINWCPRCGTALSNEEAEPVESEGELWRFRYPLAAGWEAAAAEAAAIAGRMAAEATTTGDAPDSSGEDGESGEGAAPTDAPLLGVERLEDGRWALTVATTRPETLFGDTGVAVNPSDPRYAGLVGAEVELPLTGRRIPVVADSFVDPSFGTGIVKVTPAHDPNDFEIARRTGLPLLDVMEPTAVLGEHAPEAFRGMDRFDARKAVIREMKGTGLFAGSRPHAHAIPHCYRCDTVVEPRLSEQWFVRMRPLAEPALAARRKGEVAFVPERWGKVYDEWLENIRDWCISRQLWWGHRIPVWSCEGCEREIVAVETPTECPSCGSGELRQDPDVLDTWFSSWLWPFSVFGWPEETEALRAFYPGRTLVTAPEILFFWVARMVMSGIEFRGEVPFDHVFLHGTVRDRLGRKMSKSLGNGIDPLEVVRLFGADALRYTLVSSCAAGTDIHLDHEDLEGSFAPGRNFANKVWNAGRFTLMSLGEDPVQPIGAIGDDLQATDRWILSRLEWTAGEVSRALEQFRLHEAAALLYHFFWGEIADWYLELVKGRVRGEEGAESRDAARATLVAVLDGALRLLHPIIPFVTEALWEKLPTPVGETRGPALIVASWPDGTGGFRDPDAEKGVQGLQEVITAIRSIRKEYGIPEKARVQLRIRCQTPLLRELLSGEEGSIRRLAMVDEILWVGSSDEGERGVGANAVLLSGTELFIPLEGVIDLEKERLRLQGEIERVQGLLRGVTGKLSNERFVSRAPEEIVAKERERAEDLRTRGEALAEKLRILTEG